jgi:hypothetical protein
MAYYKPLLQNKLVESRCHELSVFGTTTGVKPYFLLICVVLVVNDAGTRSFRK